MADEKLITLRDALKKIHNNGEHDPEMAHSQADDLLLEYIGDAEVIMVYDSIQKWYA